MKEQIERLRGGVAWAMTGIGPKPVLAPPNDGGTDGGNDDNGDQGGDGNADAGGDDGGKADGGKEGDTPKSKLEGKGLFSRRSQQQSGEGDDNNDGGDPPADGRPKGLAEKFWDADKKAIRIDALIKAQTDAEKALGELKRQKGPGGGEVPETPEGYFSDGLTVPDTADRYQGLTADDPGVKAWASACKKHGIGKDLAATLMSEMLVSMNDHAPVPLDPEQEMASLGKGGPAMVDGLFVWVDGMERAGDLSEDDIDVVEQIMGTAKGARFLAKMRNLTGEKPIPVDPGHGVRGMSPEQLDAEYKDAVKRKDYKRQAELDELRNQVSPEGTAPGISGRAGGYSI